MELYVVVTIMFSVELTSYRISDQMETKKRTATLFGTFEVCMLSL